MSKSLFNLKALAILSCCSYLLWNYFRLKIYGLKCIKYPPSIISLVMIGHMKTFYFNFIICVAFQTKTRYFCVIFPSSFKVKIGFMQSNHRVLNRLTLNIMNSFFHYVGCWGKVCDYRCLSVCKLDYTNKNTTTSNHLELDGDAAKKEPFKFLCGSALF